jgi:hypothetical protein
MKKQMKNLTLATAMAFLTTGALAELDKNKLQKTLPSVKIVSEIELKPDYFEIQVIEKGNLVKRSLFYTNATVDFIAPSFTFVENFDISIEKPDLGYKKLDLRKLATLVVGEGEERTVFLNPLSESGLAEMNNILAGNGYQNNVFVYFDKEDAVQLLFSLPIYYGTNAEKIIQAHQTANIIADITSKRINSEQATAKMEKRITDIQGSSSKETMDELADTMKIAFELRDIFTPRDPVSKQKKYEVLMILDSNKNNVTPKPKVIVPHSQKIETYDFSKKYGAEVHNKLVQYYQENQKLNSKNKLKEYDFSGTNIEKLIADATGFKIGSGETKVLLFSDIDCPYCVRLDKALKTNLKPGIEVSMIYFPIQGLHPNALDKTRHVLSVPESKREDLHSSIQGTSNNGILSKQEISDISPERMAEEIDPTIQMGVSLSTLLGVMGTPTVMLFKDGIISVLPNAGVILQKTKNKR